MRNSRIISLAVAGVLLLSNGVALAKKPVPISECGTQIFEPGKYYVTQDLYCAPYVKGIEVPASDVTVDLMGHTITCHAENGDDWLVGAVLIGDWFDPAFMVENVRVKNGTVTGCDDGVIFFYAESGKVTKISAIDNPDGGITLVDARNTLVKKNTAAYNAAGMRTYGGVGNVWNKNFFMTTFGPADCMGIPYELDEDDVCALDDDSD